MPQIEHIFSSKYLQEYLITFNNSRIISVKIADFRSVQELKVKSIPPILTEKEGICCSSLLEQHQKESLKFSKNNLCTISHQFILEIAVRKLVQSVLQDFMKQSAKSKLSKQKKLSQHQSRNLKHQQQEQIFDGVILPTSEPQILMAVSFYPRNCSHQSITLQNYLTRHKGQLQRYDFLKLSNQMKFLLQEIHHFGVFLTDFSNTTTQAETDKDTNNQATNSQINLNLFAWNQALNQPTLNIKAVKFKHGTNNSQRDLYEEKQVNQLKHLINTIQKQYITVKDFEGGNNLSSNLRSKNSSKQNPSKQVSGYFQTPCKNREGGKSPEIGRIQVALQKAKVLTLAYLTNNFETLIQNLRKQQKVLKNRRRSKLEEDSTPEINSSNHNVNLSLKEECLTIWRLKFKNGYRLSEFCCSAYELLMTDSDRNNSPQKTKSSNLAQQRTKIKSLLQYHEQKGKILQNINQLSQTNNLQAKMLNEQKKTGMKLGMCHPENKHAMVLFGHLNLLEQYKKSMLVYSILSSDFLPQKDSRSSSSPENTFQESLNLYLSNLRRQIQSLNQSQIQFEKRSVLYKSLSQFSFAKQNLTNIRKLIAELSIYFHFYSAILAKCKFQLEKAEKHLLKASKLINGMLWKQKEKDLLKNEKGQYLNQDKRTLPSEQRSGLSLKYLKVQILYELSCIYLSSQGQGKQCKQKVLQMFEYIDSAYGKYHWLKIYGYVILFRWERKYYFQSEPASTSPDTSGKQQLRNKRDKKYDLIAIYMEIRKLVMFYFKNNCLHNKSSTGAQNYVSQKSVSKSKLETYLNGVVQTIDPKLLNELSKIQQYVMETLVPENEEEFQLIMEEQVQKYMKFLQIDFSTIDFSNASPKSEENYCANTTQESKTIKPSQDFCFKNVQFTKLFCNLLSPDSRLITDTHLKRALSKGAKMSRPRIDFLQVKKLKLLMSVLNKTFNGDNTQVSSLIDSAKEISEEEVSKILSPSKKQNKALSNLRAQKEPCFISVCLLCANVQNLLTGRQSFRTMSGIKQFKSLISRTKNLLQVSKIISKHHKFNFFSKNSVERLHKYCKILLTVSLIQNKSIKAQSFEEKRYQNQTGFDQQQKITQERLKDLRQLAKIMGSLKLEMYLNLQEAKIFSKTESVQNIEETSFRQQLESASKMVNNEQEIILVQKLRKSAGKQYSSQKYREFFCRVEKFLQKHLPFLQKVQQKTVKQGLVLISTGQKKYNFEKQQKLYLFPLKCQKSQINLQGIEKVLQKIVVCHQLAQKNDQYSEQIGEQSRNQWGLQKSDLPRILILLADILLHQKLLPQNYSRKHTNFHKESIHNMQKQKYENLKENPILDTIDSKDFEREKYGPLRIVYTILILWAQQSFYCSPEYIPSNSDSPLNSLQLLEVITTLISLFKLHFNEHKIFLILPTMDTSQNCQIQSEQFDQSDYEVLPNQQWKDYLLQILTSKSIGGQGFTSNSDDNFESVYYKAVEKISTDTDDHRTHFNKQVPLSIASICFWLSTQSSFQQKTLKPFFSLCQNIYKIRSLFKAIKSILRIDSNIRVQEQQTPSCSNENLILDHLDKLELLKNKLLFLLEETDTKVEEFVVSHLSSESHSQIETQQKPKRSTQTNALLHSQKNQLSNELVKIAAFIEENC